MKHLTSLFFFLNIFNLFAQYPLEIRFQPDSSVYSYQINANPIEVHTIVLQNIAVVNTGQNSLEINRLTISAFKDSVEIQTTTIHQGKIDSYANRLHSIQEAGKLEFLEAKLQTKTYLENIYFCASRWMNENNAIVITTFPLLFENLPDKIVVSVFGYDNQGKEVVSTNEIKVIQYKSNNQYSFPLKGTWSAFGAPSLNSHHRWVGIQEFSYDFIKMDKNGNSHKKDGSKFKHYYAYGEDVVSVGDGKVVSVINAIEESDILLQSEDSDEHWMKVKALQNELMQKGFEYVLGNHVIIEHENGEYSYYMHLKTNSITVQVGDTIKKGLKIGELGQSGMSSEPHLHFQLSDSPDILKSRCLPIVFSNIGDKNWNILYGEIIKTDN
ncbi:M23 family metallopeptidase [bacterium]|nr:M23 family metallopeptidase [bacterium]